MSNPDIVSTYFPALADIPAENVRAVRRRLYNYLLRANPDLDMRPNTPFGDLWLTPAAQELAALEVAMGRFMSDLDLEQVAKGVIWNCFGRETEFVTRAGVRSFQDFTDGDVVTVLTAAGNWKSATVRNHGMQALNRLTIRRGKLDYTVRATSGHRWLLRNGADTTAVKVGDVLQEAPCIFEPWDYFSASPEERVAWAYGYIFGDGSVLRDADGAPKWSHVRLCGDDKQKFAERFRELGFSESSPKSCRGDVMFSTGCYVKEPLSTEENFQVLQAFCRGYLDADAAKNHNRPSSLKRSNQKEYLSIQATGEPHRSFVRDVMPVIGQYITYEHDVSHEVTNFGQRGATSLFGLNNWIYDQAPKFVVEEVQPDGVDNVWCLEVEDDRSFVLPFGLATGNCDFVEAYLKNFAIVPLTGAPATGIVRLTFNKDQDYELDASLQLAFSGGTGSIFNLRLNDAGPAAIRQVGAPPDDRPNQYRLVQLSPTRFAVDIPVEGSMTSPVLQGAGAKTSSAVDCLESVVAIEDFDDGIPEDSLPKQAERARVAFPSATLTSRTGAINLLLRQFPDLRAVSAVLPGDVEAVRDAYNVLGISTGGMDVHVRSRHALHQVTQQVRLNFYAEQEDEAQDVFVGKVEFLHPPHLIKSVAWAGGASVDLGTRGEDVIVISRSADAAAAPGLLCAFSPLEELYVAVRMPRTGAGAALVSVLYDDADQAYAYFDITYLTDPLINPVHDYVTSEKVHPVGSRVHVRGFNSIYFNHLTVDYRRAPGTTMNLAAAKAEIFAYMNSRGGPMFPYSDGPIVDAMAYAGAQQVMAIRADARVLWTAADRFLPDGELLPTVHFNDSLAATVTPQQIHAPSSSAFQPVWVDPNLGTPTSLHSSLGIRNTAYLLEESAIRFSEV